MNVDYPDRLAEAGTVRRRHHAGTSLDQAGARAARGNLPGGAHHLARAYAEAAHARLCEARERAFHEKDNLERAELTHLNEILTALNTDPVTLTQRAMQARAFLLVECGPLNDRFDRDPGKEIEDFLTKVIRLERLGHESVGATFVGPAT